MTDTEGEPVGDGGGYDAELGALRSGASGLVAASRSIEALGTQASGGATSASGGVLGGPLVGALAAFGERLETRSSDLGHAVDAASRAVGNCATTYEQDDASASSRMMADGASISAGAPLVGGLYTTMLAPQPAPAASGLSPVIPGLTTP